MGHRLRRLPDPPHKIARGIAAGVFVSFSPLFGLHFVYAALIAFLMRGNILAALLATFVGNPVTFPVFAAMSMTTGYWLLGREAVVPLGDVFGGFARASGELWDNMVGVFTDDVTHWGSLAQFFHEVFLPYLVGGFVPGTIAGLAAYMLARPVIQAYQNRRIAKRRARFMAGKKTRGGAQAKSA